MEGLFDNLDFGKLPDIMRYDQHSPLLFNSGLFLLLFVGFLMIHMSLRKKLLARIIYVTLFSLYFYYKSSGLYFLLLVFISTSDYFIGKGIATAASQKVKKWLLVLSLVVDLGLLAYFKYFNFFVESIVGIAQALGDSFDWATLKNINYERIDIFLPIGISFFTFQTISYIIDIYKGRIEPVKRWIDYIFYVSFFPQLVAGPIVRAKDFIPQIYKEPALSRAELGEGLFLIVCGLFKKAVISDYISMNFVDRVFDQPLLYTGLENLMGVYGYALQIYCDFSGYSDMAIGLALLLGFKFNINFDSPCKSASITEFWRRWHISLSSWLKDYLYISLGGNRKGKVRTYANLLTTMLLGGLWHGASVNFILWGGLHGVSLAAHKAIMTANPKLKACGYEMKPWVRIAGMVVTFHIVCFGWILFRAKSLQTVIDMNKQIFTNFHAEILPQFVGGYTLVLMLMLLGYMLHFVPKSGEKMAKSAVSRSPLIVQAALLAIFVFLVVQFRLSLIHI